jgi:large subunit ribosomal protein L15
MKLNEIRPAEGATHSKKRVGRGVGSGHGVYSGRGLKGQKARAGGSRPARFEGGQLSLALRLPHKRGFVNIFKVEYTPVNLASLERFPDGAEVTPDVLVDAGIIKSSKEPVKVLGDGELSHALIVSAHKFSVSAKTKIETAGGTIIELSPALVKQD